MSQADKPMSGGSDLVVVGIISSAFGVRGWVKVHSYTDPVTNILQYFPWQIRQSSASGDWSEKKVLSGRPHGKGIVVQLENIADRDQADLLRGAEIGVSREQFPSTSEVEHYWADLIGLTVENLQGETLGKVDSLLATGANDVLVVRMGEQERLIPYVVEHVVKTVDYETQCIKVDWDSDF